MADIQYHAPGFNRAHSLALQGKVNRGANWAPPAAPKPDDCLGTSLAYPVVRGNTLCRAGIVAAKGAAQRPRDHGGNPDVAAACDRLLKIIDEKKGLTSAKVEAAKLAALRAPMPVSYSDRSVQVDEDAGVIRNVALMTLGPTIGHGFDIDSTSIDQLIALATGQAADGVKTRFRHPEIEEKKDAQGNVTQSMADDTGTMVGRIKNVRRDGDQARGDVYLGGYAEIIPGLGDVRKYLLLHAKEDPSGIGMSAMFAWEPLPITDDYGEVQKIVARLTELYAIDFVGKPAANPNGLLSARIPGSTGGSPVPSSALSTQHSAPNSGWQDPKPKDQATAPIPVVTPDQIIAGHQAKPAQPVPPAMPANCREYLAAIAKDGPLHLGGLAARFSGRLEAMRAGADWLCANGYAEKLPRGQYKVTPKGVTTAAMCWNQ